MGSGVSSVTSRLSKPPLPRVTHTAVLAFDDDSDEQEVVFFNDRAEMVKDEREVWQESSKPLAGGAVAASPTRKTGWS